MDWSLIMQMSVSDAKGHLLELIRLAQSGEDVVLTRRGIEVVRLTPVRPVLSATTKRKALDELKAEIQALGPASGTGNHDFLYDQNGLPG